MNLQFIKFSSSGNITVLVTSPVPRERQAEIAVRLLAHDGVGGEQVGYIEPPADDRAPARLQMMGGEFCGNASMSLGAVLARKSGLPDGKAADMLLEVSGCAALVSCRIERVGSAWRGTVQMPLPTAIGEIELETDDGFLRVPLVRMPGIAHLIPPAAAGLSEAQLRRRLPEWNQAISADALGVLTWDTAASAIDPLVYVPSTGTIVREHGCGSGTAAIGCWQAVAAGKTFKAPIRQPGGDISVTAKFGNGAVTEVAITGTIKIVAEGTAYME